MPRVAVHLADLDLAGLQELEIENVAHRRVAGLLVACFIAPAYFAFVPGGVADDAILILVVVVLDRAGRSNDLLAHFHSLFTRNIRRKESHLLIQAAVVHVLGRKPKQRGQR